MLTVLVATLNGGDTLPEVLAAYRTLQPPPGGWKLVVADNGSSDGTRAIVEAAARDIPLTYMFEPRPGKNQALNTALAHAEGDLLVFTDDDALPCADWLCHLRRAADRAQDFAIFGGRVVPRWPFPPPDWLLQAVPLGPAFGVLPPLPAGPVRPHAVFGANMAIRASVFAQGYRFDTTIGPCGRHYAQGSESELTARLTRAGFKSWHCPEAVVEHLIEPEQLTESWVLGRARRYGRGQLRLAAVGGTRFVVPFLGVPLRLSLAFVKQTLRVLAARLRADRTRLVEARWNWNYLLGNLEEAYLQRHRVGREHAR